MAHLYDPKRFNLFRTEDPSGVSGVGVVAEGVYFDDGHTVIHWCVKGMPRSTSVFSDFDDMYRVHGHNGATRVDWLDRSDGQL